jgi:hypothetical protein
METTHITPAAKESVKEIVASLGELGSAKTSAPPIAVAEPAIAAFSTGDQRRIDDGI